MISLESDKITALWPGDSLTFTFYETFSHIIPNWITLVKKVFDLMIRLESDKMTALWLNDECDECDILKKHVKMNNFC